ncbi:MAG: hypothetical protein R3F29_10370 [Planctomycetota bacterium]
MSRTLLVSVLLAASAFGQSITLAEGSPASLDVVMLRESDPTAVQAVVLQGAELLPVEITGRTLADAGDVSRVRVVDGHGIQRVELPDGGRLLRYRRAAGAFYGYLHVAANGVARVVLERPAAAGQSDPFGDRIAVARDARHAAVTAAAGGVYVVRLDGLSFASTGAPWRRVANTQEIDPMSVLIGPEFVWFQNDTDQVFRCRIADGAQPDEVSPPPIANGRLKPQMAMSGDGTRIVYIYGQQQQNNQLLYTVGTTGGASLVPLPPSKYEEPGYLPEEPGEPAMLLDEHGERLFCVDADVRDELWLVDLTGVLAPLQITEDQIFEPYIGVHVIPGFYQRELTVAIGDPNQMDWFRAKLTSQGGEVVNLTGTGSMTQPFISGQLDPRTAVATRGGRLSIEQQAGGSVVRRVPDVGAASTVVASGLAAAPELGTTLTGVADLVAPRAAGDLLLLSGGGVAALALPQGLTFGLPATGPLFSAVSVEVPGGFAVPVIYLPDGGLLLGGLEAGLEQVAVTAGGGMLLNGATLRYLAPGRFVSLNRPAVPFRRVLSGAGV